MADQLLRALGSLVAFSYGLFNLLLYTATALKDGTFFKRPTEKEDLELRLGVYIHFCPFFVLNAAFLAFS